MDIPRQQIRAVHTASTVTVYQAYAPEIGGPAVRHGRFPAAWKRDRMTWIKPSFLWMMYRCGWGTKEGQETVLAVEITRDGFEWALEHACLAHYDPALHPDHDAWKRELKRAPARASGTPNATCTCGRCRTVRCNSASRATPRAATPTSGRSPSPMSPRSRTRSTPTCGTGNWKPPGTCCRRSAPTPSTANSSPGCGDEPHIRGGRPLRPDLYAIVT